jgi:sodium-dependent phosphate cotransporter
VLIFFPIPIVKELPIFLANKLGKLTLRYRVAGFLFLLVTFFLVPFSLIYFHKNNVKISELTYQVSDFVTQKNATYSIVVKTYEMQQLSRWHYFETPKPFEDGSETKVISVYRKKNLLFIENELIELNKPGFCKDGEDVNGKFKICLEEIMPSFSINPNLQFDSVFVFRKDFYVMPADSSFTKVYLSASTNTLLRKEKRTPAGLILWKEELILSVNK